MLLQNVSSGSDGCCRDTDERGGAKGAMLVGLVESSRRPKLLGILYGGGQKLQRSRSDVPTFTFRARAGLTSVKSVISALPAKQGWHPRPTGLGTQTIRATTHAEGTRGTLAMRALESFAYPAGKGGWREGRERGETRRTTMSQSSPVYRKARNALGVGRLLEFSSLREQSSCPRS